MCLAHNAMIRNLNAIYLQCENVNEPQDQADFIIFCQAAIEVIHTHHQMEEENFFPQVAEYTGENNIMEGNIEQHRAFDRGLQVFEQYIYKLKPEDYDGKELKRLLEGFSGVLVEHLSDEIQTLLALEKYGGEKLGVVFKNFNDKVMGSVKDKVSVQRAPEVLL
jgi:hemerythrin-like domain-containing protein